MATKPLPLARTKELYEAICLIVNFLYQRLPTGPISKPDKKYKEIKQILCYTLFPNLLLCMWKPKKADFMVCMVCICVCVCPIFKIILFNCEIIGISIINMIRLIKNLKMAQASRHETRVLAILMCKISNIWSDCGPQMTQTLCGTRDPGIS